MNLIPEIAKMLGVGVGEEFEVLPRTAATGYKSSRYRFSEQGLEFSNYIHHPSETGWSPTDTITGLLNGKISIVKLPFKPKEHERYWYVYVGDDEIGNTRFSEANTNDLMRVYCGNCFRSEAEAEKHKYEIYEKLTGKKWEE